MSITLNKNADNIYVNVTFNHNNSLGNQPTAAEIRETKTIPILDKCDDYYCAVIRFDIPLNDVPLFIMPIIPNQTINPNLTPMVIGVSYSSVDYPQNIIYVPSNPSAIPPIQNQLTQVISPYYFCFSYLDLIDIINTALSTAWIAAGSPGKATTPFFFLNNTTGLISLIVSKAFVDDGATIFMNEHLINFLDAFKANFNSFNSSIGKTFIFNLTNYNSNNWANSPPAPAAFATTPYLIFTQEYPVLGLWSSLRKILITSSSIPITPEFAPLSTTNQGVSSTLPIISDFVPEIEMAGQGRSVAYFVPTTQYRLIDMKSSIQLNTIDLKIYWQDKYNNIYPLNISILQQASVKLGFFKKYLYNSEILTKK